MADDEILTIREVAALLKIGEKTAYTMAQSGELPGFEVRGQWRFRRIELDRWIGALQLDFAGCRGRRPRPFRCRA